MVVFIKFHLVKFPVGAIGIGRLGKLIKLFEFYYCRVKIYFSWVHVSEETFSDYLEINIPKSNEIDIQN